MEASFTGWQTNQMTLSDLLCSWHCQFWRHLLPNLLACSLEQLVHCRYFCLFSVTNYLHLNIYLLINKSFYFSTKRHLQELIRILTLIIAATITTITIERASPHDTKDVVVKCLHFPFCLPCHILRFDLNNHVAFKESDIEPKNTISRRSNMKSRHQQTVHALLPVQTI